MVKTANNVLDNDISERIGALEDISIEKHKSIASKKKELEEYEKTKKKELDDLDKKRDKELKDLESKRKELKDLEEKKSKEIEDNKRLIDRSLQDIVRHKKIIKETEESEAKRTKSIEDLAGNDERIESLKSLEFRNNFEHSGTYSSAKRLYDITNNDFYANLTRLRDRAIDGEITSEEQSLINNLRNKVEQFNNNDSYLEKDKNNYIQRSLSILNQIGNYSKLKGNN